MEISRDELIKKLVNLSTKTVTYEELLEDYREELTEHFEELTNEKLIELVEVQEGLLRDSTKNDIKRSYLLIIQVAEIILDSSTLEEAQEKIKPISGKLFVKNTKKTLQELKEIAIIDLKEATEKLKQFEEEENGNN